MARCIPFSLAKSMATMETESRQSPAPLSSVCVQGLAVQGSAQTVEPPKRLIIRIKIAKQRKEDEFIKPSSDGTKVAETGVKSKGLELEKAILIEEKLEATKRKLHERYEQLQTFKRQKSIQVLSYVPSQNFKITKKPQKPANKTCLQPRRVPKKPGGFQSMLLDRLVPC